MNALTGIHYNKAPITEAVIDFRVDLPSAITISDLQRLCDENPSLVSTEIKQTSFSISVGGNNAPLPLLEPTSVGFQLRTPDNLRVYKIELNGFTSSRLAPYDNWADLRDQTRELWEKFKAVCNPEQITRVGIRYINRCDLPLPVQAFEDYFRTFVLVSPDLPQNISNFVMQLMIPLPEVEAVAVINEALAPSMKPNSVAVMLDIDVFSNARITDDNEAWQILERLRIEKNKIFEACITNKFRELIN